MSDAFFQTPFVTSKQLENVIISKAADVERIVNVFKQQEAAGGEEGTMSDEQKSNNAKYLDEVSSEVSALQAVASNAAHHTPGPGSRSGSSDTFSTED